MKHLILMLSALVAVSAGHAQVAAVSYTHLTLPTIA